jgi:aldose 1-epimerase
MFHTTRLLLLSSLAILVHSQAPPSPGAPAPGPAAPVITTPIPVGADGKYTIETDGLRAQFLPAGASLTNLFLKDMNGVERDIVVGRDTAAAAAADTKFTNIGGVVGRYTNRIKGGYVYL